MLDMFSCCLFKPHNSELPALLNRTISGYLHYSTGIVEGTTAVLYFEVYLFLGDHATPLNDATSARRVRASRQKRVHVKPMSALAHLEA